MQLKAKIGTQQASKQASITKSCLLVRKCIYFADVCSMQEMFVRNLQCAVKKLFY